MLANETKPVLDLIRLGHTPRLWLATQEKTASAFAKIRKLEGALSFPPAIPFSWIYSPFASAEKQMAKAAQEENSGPYSRSADATMAEAARLIQGLRQGAAIHPGRQKQWHVFTIDEREAEKNPQLGSSQPSALPIIADEKRKLHEIFLRVTNNGGERPGAKVFQQTNGPIFQFHAPASNSQKRAFGLPLQILPAKSEALENLLAGKIARFLRRNTLLREYAGAREAEDSASTWTSAREGLGQALKRQWSGRILRRLDLSETSVTRPEKLSGGFPARPWENRQQSDRVAFSSRSSAPASAVENSQKEIRQAATALGPFSALLQATRKYSQAPLVSAEEINLPLREAGPSLPPESSPGKTPHRQRAPAKPSVVKPSIRNTFNIHLHEGGGAQSDVHELADKIAEILAEQARRHGIDLT